MPKKTMTMAELHAHALKHGAEVSVGNRRFNAARQQMAVTPPPPKPLAVVAPIKRDAPAAPPAAAAHPAAAPAPDSVSRAELERLLSEQEERFSRQLALIADLIRNRPDDDGDDETEVPTTFTPSYNEEGRITQVAVEYTRLQ